MLGGTATAGGPCRELTLYSFRGFEGRSGMSRAAFGVLALTSIFISLYRTFPCQLARRCVLRNRRVLRCTSISRVPDGNGVARRYRDLIPKHWFESNPPSMRGGNSEAEYGTTVRSPVLKTGKTHRYSGFGSHQAAALRVSSGGRRDATRSCGGLQVDPWPSPRLRCTRWARRGRVLGHGDPLASSC